MGPIPPSSSRTIFKRLDEIVFEELWQNFLVTSEDDPFNALALFLLKALFWEGGCDGWLTGKCVTSWSVDTVGVENNKAESACKGASKTAPMDFFVK